MWTEWFLPSSAATLLWVAIGTCLMYLTILLLARWSGVRSFAEMSTFDIAVTIAIGSIFATTIASKDPALLQGVTALATLFAIQLGTSRIRSRSARFKATTDNGPILLMGPGGRMMFRNMAVARVTEDDLRTHLREANVIDPATVDAVVMEGTGRIHVLHGHGLDRIEDAWIVQGARNYER